MTTSELSTGDQIDPQIADLSLLLSDQRRDRLRAIHSLSTPLAPAAGFAIRRLLFTDRDAHVRAAAARALGTQPSGSAAETWLLDRATDVSPLVRDAIIRALARCGTAASAPTLRTFVAHDPIWWVRRAATTRT